MLVDIIVPEAGESITEGTISAWLARVGDSIQIDQPLFELETDKASAEVPSPAAGVLKEILVEAGQDVAVGAVVGRIDNTADGTARTEAADPPAEQEAAPDETSARPPSPAARRMIEEQGLDAEGITGSGREGQVLKEDVLAYVAEAKGGDSEFPMGSTIATAAITAPPPVESTIASLRLPKDPIQPVTPEPAPPTLPLMREPRGRVVNKPVPPSPQAPPLPAPQSRPMPQVGDRPSRRVPMTRLRRSVARRLKDAQNTAAMLTTFNEVDMSALMALRARYKQAFADKHGIKLGFMSFFAKAAVEALKAFPTVNAFIDDKDIIYNDFYDIGVAVSTDRGLVVPVMRDVDRLSFAEVEMTIAGLAQAGRDNQLTLEHLSGGTFTITNGGVFGSMLSTPILNPPQSAILGMHTISKRAVVVEGDRIEARPVMFLALSYDHRLVDGAQAVRFLVTIKQIIEDPARLLLEV
jgi:2-oxoglutarate dehydrogenase E2 component (dihydrolipoamide succinyltransferase)